MAGRTVPLDPRILADGNSQTSGTYPAKLAILMGEPVANHGVFGQTTNQMIARAPTQIDALLEPAYAYAQSVLVAAEVRNALAQDLSKTPRQAVDELWAYFDGRRAFAAATPIPLKMIVWNILPSTEGAALNAKFVEANGYIAAEWASHADGYFDVRSDARLTDPTNTTYFSDGLHLTSAGNQILAQLVYDAIQAL